jgi:hypothetical protein
MTAITSMPTLTGKNFNVSSGSGCDRRLFEFVAGKRSAKFRFPEAVVRRRVLATESSHSAIESANGRKAEWSHP